MTSGSRTACTTWSCRVSKAGRWPLVSPGRGGRCAALVLALFTVAPLSAAPDKEYAVRGMVVRVDQANRTFVVSHERIVGLMDSMIMPFEVRDAKELTGVVPGALVDFVLVVGDKGAYATRFQIRRYESMEQDPRTARRLTVMKRAAGLAVAPLALGARVPDFTLIDQTRQRVTLSSLAGKVVVLNFVYTRCALPQFCLRVANNFGVLQKRFEDALGRDVVLLTITFDPERDTPDVLARYASQWKADSRTWHFLTGAVADVRRVCALFGMEYFPDEGLMSHTLRTAVIDRTGTLVASIEGNQYTPEQLGDLVFTAINSSER